MKILTTFAISLTFPLLSNAAITVTQDAADFSWIYTQDVDSSAEDLDGAGSANDFFAGNAAEHPSIAGGVASFTNGDFYRGDFGGSLSRTQFLTVGDPFTIELNARMLSTGSASGTFGTMAIFWRANTDESTIMYIDDAQVSVSNGGTIQVLSTADNTDAFHDFRLAFDGTEFSVWRDGDLLGEELAPASIGGADGLFVGDTSGTGNNGDWQLDNMAITLGAFAPVPEPSSVALAGLTGLLLLRRRR